jgi:hypothetical protein
MGRMRLLVFPWLLASGVLLSADTPGELVTDRPDFTESSQVVPRGWVQIESGLALETSNAENRHSIAFGTPLIRVGLIRKLELRIGADGAMYQRLGDERSGGFSDMDFGVKYKFMEEGRFRPAMSAIAAISTPIGQSTFSSGAYEPAIKLTWEKDVIAGFSAAGNFNWSALAVEGGRLHQRVASLSIGHGLGRGFSGFWEVYGFTAEERGRESAYMFASGLIRAVGKNAQWDVNVHRRMGAQGPDWIVSAGFVARMPWSLP